MLRGKQQEKGKAQIERIKSPTLEKKTVGCKSRRRIGRKTELSRKMSAQGPVVGN